MNLSKNEVKQNYPPSKQLFQLTLSLYKVAYLFKTTLNKYPTKSIGKINI